MQTVLSMINNWDVIDGKEQVNPVTLYEGLHLQRSFGCIHILWHHADRSCYTAHVLPVQLLLAKRVIAAVLCCALTSDASIWSYADTSCYTDHTCAACTTISS